MGTATKEKLREKLNLKDINRSRMAEATGIDVGHASRVLSGQRNPSLGLAKRIADYLKISLDELYRMLFPEEKNNGHG